MQTITHPDPTVNRPTPDECTCTTCTCSAYPRPHPMYSGRCIGYRPSYFWRTCCQAAWEANPAARYRSEIPCATIEFRQPLNHDLAVVAAEFTLRADSAGRELSGCIYTCGACFCSDYKSRGHCRHAAAWTTLQAWPDLLSITDANAKRRAEMIERFAEVIV